MAIAEQRIHTLKKQEILKKNFESSHLPHDFTEIKFTIKEDEPAKKQYERFVSAINRKQKDFWLNATPEEKIAFMQEKLQPDFPISFRLLKEGENDYTDYLILLLAACIKANRHESGFVEKYQPVEITIEKDGENQIFYSLLEGNIPKKHFNGVKFPGAKYTYVKLLNTKTFFAESWILAELLKFAQSDLETTQFLVARYLQKAYGFIPFRLPALSSDPTFRAELQSVMEKYKIPTNPHAQETTLPKTLLDLFHGTTTADNSFLISIILPEFLQKMEHIREKSAEEYESAQSYARSFETKKNISPSTKKAMEKNVFRSFYGFVELDNDVDLTKFKKIEEDFQLFAEKVRVPNCPDHSFRIKKLGQHRAAGLYYPTMKSTIFDLESPDAYAHELGHQIDYVFDSLSEKLDFRVVMDNYKSLVNATVEKMDKENSFRIGWEGKNKYNKHYYFKNTEIFARCFELYLSKKGIQSSLMKESLNTPVYPKEEEFLKKIENYFDKTLNIIR